MSELIPNKPAGSWVQTERSAHEAWARLIGRAPKAAQLMNLLVSKIGSNNAVVISQKSLMVLMGVKSLNTVKAAISVLREERWVEVRPIGDRGTVNAYIVNDRVAWSGPRDGIRYSLFSANIVLSSEEQADGHDLDNQPALRKVPSIYPEERQLPTGPGEPPPSQPSFEGMEPDLPYIEKQG